MRFAITAIDRFQGVLDAFLEAGWEALKLFSVPVNNVTEHNSEVIARARSVGADIQLSRMSERDLAELAVRGCEALIVASYDWRVPDWRPYLRYACNFHPSPLPEGRGPYPLVRAVLEERPHWGVTCHVVEHAFDSGAILAQECFPCSRDECHESLLAKTQWAAQRLAGRVARDFPALWENARPQAGGSTWGRWTEAERTLNFTRPVADLMRQLRAFGLLECLAEVNGVRVYVRRAHGWTAPHAHAPGTVVFRESRTLVVAVADGYLALVEWALVSLQEARALGR